MENLYLVASKWWKQWYAGMSDKEKQDFKRELEASNLSINDVLEEMMRIHNNIFKE